MSLWSRIRGWTITTIPADAPYATAMGWDGGKEGWSRMAMQGQPNKNTPTDWEMEDDDSHPGVRKVWLLPTGDGSNYPVYECGTCGALTTAPSSHIKWHVKVGDIVPTDKRS